MTENHSARKPRLKERRKARAERSAARQREHIESRLAGAETPLDLLGREYEILRGRLVQAERRALAAVDRASTPEQQATAGDRLAGTRAQMERVCGEAVAVMARLTDQIHTERR